MGARKVLGVAVVVAALAAPRAARAGDEAVIVIDLRPGDPAALRGSRAELVKELGGIAGIAVRADAGLDAALAGEASDSDASEVHAALDEARAAFAVPDCARTVTAAERAIDLLAARQAAGLDDGSALRGAWAYVLLCADRDGDGGRAQRAAQRLRALGVVRAEDAGLSDATWKRFPEIDASTEEMVAVPVSAQDNSGAANATVWVDHVRLGAAPVTAHLAPGEHVIAAGAGARRGAVRVTVAGKGAPVAIPLVDRAARWSQVAGVIAGWRAGANPPTADALTSVLQALEVRFALVLAGTDTVQVWALGPKDERARKIDDGVRAESMAIASMIVDRVAAWDGNAPDPDAVLLREGDVADDWRKRTPNRWWVYAAIVGAVAAGTTILYLQDSADDHQRIVIRF